MGNILKIINHEKGKHMKNVTKEDIYASGITGAYDAAMKKLGSVLTAWQYHRNNGLFQAGEMLFHMDMHRRYTESIAEHHDRIRPAEK